jgi:CHASE3 domain sensor protein/putative methionine-R-sulfoxide reductase with GAF domain
MIKYLKQLINQEGLTISIYITLFIIFSNTVFTFYYRNLIIENREIKEQVLAVNHHIEFMNKYVNLADLGLRGYIIDQDDKFLTPYTEAIASYQDNFDELEVLLKSQGFDVSKMAPAVNAVDVYMNLVKSMVNMCRIGDVEQAVQILKKDPGYDAWKIYSVFEGEALEFENALSEQANKTYNQMIFRMVVAQLLLMVIAVPILIFAVSTIKKAREKQREIYENLSESNNKYLFNPGEDSENEADEEGIINSLITNLQKTASFINNITNGNYSVSWDGLTKENASLNSRNIAGELTSMRDQMKKVKEEDEIRIWMSQGLSDFAEIVRSNQDNFKNLAEKLIVSLVKYLNAQQGGIFIVNKDNEDDVYLELMGCFAYDRVKTVDKRIELGQGLVGQCYLEKETVLMTQVPQDYVNITSGLGEARPDCILIVPLKLNENIEGIIELASLKVFKSHEIQFVEKLGETIASAVTTVRTAENTKLLLERSQQQAEEMRAQEEEMRQNMEELQATQEQMERKNEEIEELLRQAKTEH